MKFLLKHFVGLPCQPTVASSLPDHNGCKGMLSKDDSVVWNVIYRAGTVPNYQE